jgi:fido (protein-threonine AMPylation protein)
MSADSNDNFEYEPASSHVDEAKRRHYWAVAIGLQAVDGLVVSSYLNSLADGYRQGDYSLLETGRMIREYHADCAEGESRKRSETREADLVSQRIAELLEAAPFVLAPSILPQIHEYLFQDLDREIYRPGEFKAERMVKQEEILNGDSVLYADPLAYKSSLDMAFEAERRRSYGLSLTDSSLGDFCHTIAFIWQIHPFAEGNTRTVAVFSELYLNHLGFNVENDPFEHHSRYYRDALVRAMYRNAAAGILPEGRFLNWFYDSVVNGVSHEFDREELICAELFEHPELLRNVSPEEALVKRG